MKYHEKIPRKGLNSLVGKLISIKLIYVRMTIRLDYLSNYTGRNRFDYIQIICNERHIYTEGGRNGAIGPRIII